MLLREVEERPSHATYHASILCTACYLPPHHRHASCYVDTGVTDCPAPERVPDLRCDGVPDGVERRVEGHGLRRDVLNAAAG